MILDAHNRLFVAASVLVQAKTIGRWSQHVTENVSHHTPPGLFTKRANSIVQELLKVSNGDASLAYKKLSFYRARAGKNLPNKKEVNKAFLLLTKKKDNQQKRIRIDRKKQDQQRSKIIRRAA